MLNERMAVARKVAEPLHALERAIDLAVIEAGALTSAMATARTEAKLSAIVGQAAFDDLGRALSALMLARRHVVDTHLALDETRAYLRLPVTSFGDESEKPPQPSGLVQEPLRAVA